MKITDLLVDRLQTGRMWTNSLLADIEESRWFEMPHPGVGHVAWQVGHLAASQIVLIHVRCFGMAYTDVAPDSIRTTFARGSTPVADKSKYPSIAEIRALFDRVQNDVIHRVSGMSESELDEQAGAEPHPMLKYKAGAIAMAAMHETFHAGQIAMIRRIFGKAPLR